MKSRLNLVLNAVTLSILLPVLALAVELPAMNARPIVTRPASPALKLNTVNNMLHSLKMAPAASLPPAKVVLTPVNPVVNNNQLVLLGYYVPKLNYIKVRYNDGHFVRYFFETVPGKTYLLDINVEATSRWNVISNSGGSAPNVKEQQGHLLLPFIASSNYVDISIYPVPGSQCPGGWCRVGSAELTQIN